jgi:hypothetical protein
MAFVGGRDPGLASAAPSIATAGGAGGLFLDVRDHNPAQRILDDLANHVQLVVARYGLQGLPVFSANAIPRAPSIALITSSTEIW